MLNVFVLLNILFALLAFGIYLFSNVAIRRYVAGIRSREDYESDVDGTMTKEEKKKEKEQKVIEAEREKKIMYEDMLAKVTERLESVEKKL